MLGANLSREFRIAAGKDPITGKKEPDTTPIKRPASPTSTTEQPKTVAEQLEAPKEKPFYYSDKNDLRRKKRRKK